MDGKHVQCGDQAGACSLENQLLKLYAFRITHNIHDTNNLFVDFHLVFLDYSRWTTDEENTTVILLEPPFNQRWRMTFYKSFDFKNQGILYKMLAHML